jgi:hypothetical protein
VSIMPDIAYVCEIRHDILMKPVIRMGGSRADLKGFPEAVQASVGFELYRVQCGLEPKDWKPMTSVGAGVRGNSCAGSGWYLPYDLSRDTA